MRWMKTEKYDKKLPLIYTKFISAHGKRLPTIPISHNGGDLKVTNTYTAQISRHLPNLRLYSHRTASYYGASSRCFVGISGLPVFTPTSHLQLTWKIYTLDLTFTATRTKVGFIRQVPGHPPMTANNFTEKQIYAYTNPKRFSGMGHSLCDYAKQVTNFLPTLYSGWNAYLIDPELRVTQLHRYAVSWTLGNEGEWEPNELGGRASQRQLLS